jgi:hypothetical protein
MGTTERSKRRQEAILTDRGGFANLHMGNTERSKRRQEAILPDRGGFANLHMGNTERSKRRQEAILPDRGGSPTFIWGLLSSNVNETKTEVQTFRYRS